MSQVATDLQNQEFGERLAQLRSHLQLSQVAFAQELGCSVRAYINYERGEREPPLALVRAVYERYRVEPLWLIGAMGKVPVTEIARKLDIELLLHVVDRIDRHLARLNKRLKPASRRRLIEAAYAQCQDMGSVDEPTLTRMISLAA
jgi:transcriptional regulator with XRE-family HTH domain